VQCAGRLGDRLHQGYGLADTIQVGIFKQLALRDEYVDILNIFLTHNSLNYL
jgi:hypothetical protein